MITKVEIFDVQAAPRYIIRMIEENFIGAVERWFYADNMRDPDNALIFPGLVKRVGVGANSSPEDAPWIRPQAFLFGGTMVTMGDNPVMVSARSNLEMLWELYTYGTERPVGDFVYPTESTLMHMAMAKICEYTSTGTRMVDAQCLTLDTNDYSIALHDLVENELMQGALLYIQDVNSQYYNNSPIPMSSLKPLMAQGVLMEAYQVPHEKERGARIPPFIPLDLFFYIALMITELPFRAMSLKVHQSEPVLLGWVEDIVTMERYPAEERLSPHPVHNTNLGISLPIVNLTLGMMQIGKVLSPDILDIMIEKSFDDYFRIGVVNTFNQVRWSEWYSLLDVAFTSPAFKYPAHVEYRSW
jgi:hypothetical protein